MYQSPKETLPLVSPPIYWQGGGHRAHPQGEHGKYTKHWITFCVTEG
jgi:hypothetical protein